MALCGSQVCKVYIGSFNADKPIRTDVNPSGEDLFNKEQADLLQDLFEIPQRSCDRKVLSSSPAFIICMLANDVSFMTLVGAYRSNRRTAFKPVYSQLAPNLCKRRGKCCPIETCLAEETCFACC